MEVIMNNNLLNDDDLAQVIGGAKKKVSFEEKRNDFEDAWEFHEMEAKGFTGNRKAQLFEEWEMSEDEKPSDFLAKFLKKV